MPQPRPRHHSADGFVEERWPARACDEACRGALMMPAEIDRSQSIRISASRWLRAQLRRAMISDGVAAQGWRGERPWAHIRVAGAPRASACDAAISPIYDADLRDKKRADDSAVSVAFTISQRPAARLLISMPSRQRGCPAAAAAVSPMPALYCSPEVGCRAARERGRCQWLLPGCLFSRFALRQGRARLPKISGSAGSFRQPTSSWR